MKVPQGLRQINAVYGNPSINGNLNPKWVADNITVYTLPYYWKMKIAWLDDKGVQRTVKSFSIHKLVLPVLEKTMREVWAFARIRAKDKYGYDRSSAFYDEKTNEELEKAGMNLFGGSLNFRLKRGGSTLSMHSWGIAIDFDPANNSMGDVTPKMPIWVVEIFEANGWVWGGRWRGKYCDGMHFQLAKGA